MPTIATKDAIIENIINDPLYDIRPDGTIWSCRPLSGPFSTKGKPLIWRQIDRWDGKEKYRIVTYKGDRKGNYLRVNRIIYRKFIGLLDSNLEVNHKDGNKANNDKDNLELITGTQNIQHAIQNKLFCCGEQVGTSFLTEEEVIEIKTRLKMGHKVTQISRDYDVHHTAISKIKAGKSWNHIII